jgi:hypothetical protein
MLGVVALALTSGCEPNHERNWLFDGAWIDIDGWGRETDEACAGTFEYFDAYCGMLAKEFGVDDPLGTFRWSSRARFQAGDLPCKPGWACVRSGEAYSPDLPDEHEVVHLANHAVVRCPSVLSEGLAVYYDTQRTGSASGDLDLLSARLTAPDVTLPAREYAIAGRFAAFLVHEFGLAAVLDVCSTTGRNPDAAALSSAMEEILGAPAAELVAQLAVEPDECNEIRRYQARLYACDEDPLAPHAGIVEPNTDFERTYALGCEQEASIGSVDGTVRYIHQIEFAEADSYRIYVHYADASMLVAPPVVAVLGRCGYCGEVEEFHAGVFGYDFELDGGRYWLELRAPPDFVDPIELRIVPL